MSWGFQDLIDNDIILKFVAYIYSFGVPNETAVTLVTDIFKLSTSTQISLGCMFSQKDFTQVAQVQMPPDAVASSILALVYLFSAHRF